MKELYRPSSEKIASTQMYKFMKSIDPSMDQYSDLLNYSIAQRKEFWTELLSFYSIEYSGKTSPVLVDDNFDKYTWFPKMKLNFAKNLLARGESDDIALNFVHESGKKEETSYRELKGKVGGFEKALRPFISAGDVLACYMPNIPETVISMLGVSALGGVFTSTSSDFGIEGALDRFGQSRPKVLVAASGYTYNGKYFDQLPKIRELAEKLDCLEKIIIVNFLETEIDLTGVEKAVLWKDFILANCNPQYLDVGFDSPLYIMYSSGTTGKPKCIVHGVGGTLLQHVKELGLHTDLTREKNIFYFTTCGWMMWNWLASSLFFGAKITLYEGSPGFPSLLDFFQIIEKEEINIFGTSPKFLKALEDTGYEKEFKLNSLEMILSTGAPLLPEQFDFVYKNIKSEIGLSSICGGTDILGCFMLGNPILPVCRGEIQCIGLGMDVCAYDENHRAQVGKEGELVCQKTFPSRPIYFLDDSNQAKIQEAYFEKIPGVWHHGDFISLTDRGSVVVYGRSDATLNPGGVRIGTSEIYRQTEQLSYIEDSLCVGQVVEGDVVVVLFVKMKRGEILDKNRMKEIRNVIRSGTTPRHVPGKIHSVSDIPYTRSGKKMELAITRILAGRELTNLEAVANPACLNQYGKF